MFNCFRCLWNDEDGMILSSEVVLIGTILVIGSIAGLTSLQYAVTSELNDTARAYDSYHSYGDGATYNAAVYSVHDSKSQGEIAGNGY